MASGRLLIIEDERRLRETIGRLLHAYQPALAATAKEALALGLIRWQLRAGRFDGEFLARWTNAPFLVDPTSGRFLRARDLAPAGDDAYVVWDAAREAPAAVDVKVDPAAWGVQPALLATPAIALADGRRVTAKTALTLLRERVEAYTPAHVAALTGVPEAQVVAAATYHHPIAQGLGYVTGTFQYTGSRFTQIGDQDPAFGTVNLNSFGANTIGGPLTQSTFTFEPELPSYTLVNLRVGLLRAPGRALRPRVRARIDIGRDLARRHRAVDGFGNQLAVLDRHLDRNPHRAARLVPPDRQ